jgi:hypothetical protein
MLAGLFASAVRFLCSRRYNWSHQVLRTRSPAPLGGGIPAFHVALTGTTEEALQQLEGKLQTKLNGPRATERIERVQSPRPHIASSKALSQHLGG